MTYQDYFIPGSPVIVAAFEECPIGEFGTGISGGGYVPDAEAPHTIKRRATLAEYLATVKPEHREWVIGQVEPGALFYEVSVD